MFSVLRSPFRAFPSIIPASTVRGACTTIVKTQACAQRSLCTKNCSACFGAPSSSLIQTLPNSAENIALLYGARWRDFPINKREAIVNEKTRSYQENQKVFLKRVDAVSKEIDDFCKRHLPNDGLMDISSSYLAEDLTRLSVSLAQLSEITSDLVEDRVWLVPYSKYSSSFPLASYAKKKIFNSVKKIQSKTQIAIQGLIYSGVMDIIDITFPRHKGRQVSEIAVINNFKKLGQEIVDFNKKLKTLETSLLKFSEILRQTEKVENIRFRKEMYNTLYGSHPFWNKVQY